MAVSAAKHRRQRRALRVPLRWPGQGCDGLLDHLSRLTTAAKVSSRNSQYRRLRPAAMYPTGTALAATRGHGGQPVNVEILTPERGHRVGLDGRGWFVDLELEFAVPLADTGFTINPDLGTPGFQITGPGPHDNVAPFPGTFSPGADDRLPGLILVLTTTTAGAGPCTNLANLFNLTGVTDVRNTRAELWDTWIVGAPNFVVDTQSTLFVAVADDLDGNGIFDDAPFAVPDVDGDAVDWVG